MQLVVVCVTQVREQSVADVNSGHADIGAFELVYGECRYPDCVNAGTVPGDQLADGVFFKRVSVARESVADGPGIAGLVELGRHQEMLGGSSQFGLIALQRHAGYGLDFAPRVGDFVEDAGLGGLELQVVVVEEDSG